MSGLDHVPDLDPDSNPDYCGHLDLNMVWTLQVLAPLRPPFLPFYLVITCGGLVKLWGFLWTSHSK